jgi:hypothetical protein
MYDWEKNSANVQRFKTRDLVDLNPEWAGYEFLVTHFNHLFPRLVETVEGDLLRFKIGKMSIEFASQTLTKVRRRT